MRGEISNKEVAEIAEEKARRLNRRQQRKRRGE